MQLKKIAGMLLAGIILLDAAAFSMTPVRDSAEDLFWTGSMTVHDYKKDTDLHNIAVSVMAITELEFVHLGDGFMSLAARRPQSLISKSFDSLEYAYACLPRHLMVRRFGQTWDALQIRQLSLSDARLIGSVLGGGSLGGVTPMIQVRVYKLVVLIEDSLYDLDHAILFPMNWSVSFIRGQPFRMRSLGYAADGLGYLRWQTAAGLKRINREIVRLSSDFVSLFEKSQNVWIRHQRRKQNDQRTIYSRMPLAVFLENQHFFKGKKNKVFAGSLDFWQTRFQSSSGVLPDKLQPAPLFTEDLSALEPSQEVLLGTPYAVWDKTPRTLRKYVLTAEEMIGILSGPSETQKLKGLPEGSGSKAWLQPLDLHPEESERRPSEISPGQASEAPSYGSS